MRQGEGTIAITSVNMYLCNANVTNLNGSSIHQLYAEWSSCLQALWLLNKTYIEVLCQNYVPVLCCSLTRQCTHTRKNNRQQVDQFNYAFSIPVHEIGYRYQTKVYMQLQKTFSLKWIAENWTERRKVQWDQCRNANSAAPNFGKFSWSEHNKTGTRS